MSTVCEACRRLQTSLNTDCPVCMGRGEPHTPTANPVPATPEEDLRPGELLDDAWRVEAIIGQGGMGTVVRAHDLSLDRKVAIKVLARHLCGDAESVARFMREAQLTAKLDHSNIVPIYAVGRYQERPYLVMKLLEGTSLHETLKQREAKWSWSEARAVVAQMVAGLTHLHERGLVHRDIKPGNVFVSPTGQVTLLDFGLLKGSGSKDLTTPGQALGTWRFMPPEQMLGMTDLDARADVYSLGVIVYRMLTGVLPFSGDDYTVARQKVEGAAPRAPNVSEPVARALAHALARTREERTPSAQTLLDELDGAFARKPQRSRGALLISAIAIVGALGALAVAKWPVVKTTSESPTEETRAPLAVVDAGSEAPDEGLPERVGAPEPEVFVDAGVVAEPEVRVPPTKKRAGPSRVSFVALVNGTSSFADLFVDGKRRGETPLQLELSAGKHVVRLTRAGFLPEERVLQLGAGRSERVVVELRR